MSDTLFDNSPPFQPPRNHHDMESLTQYHHIMNLYEDLNKWQVLTIKVWHHAKEGDIIMPDELWNEIDKAIETRYDCD